MLLITRHCEGPKGPRQSFAKPSSTWASRTDCFVASLLAMTQIVPRHCEAPKGPWQSLPEPHEAARARSVDRSPRRFTLRDDDRAYEPRVPHQNTFWSITR